MAYTIPLSLPYRLNDCFEIRQTPNTGRGVFATRTISAGEVVLRDVPMYSCDNHIERLDNIRALEAWLVRQTKTVIKRFRTLTPGTGTDDFARVEKNSFEGTSLYGWGHDESLEAVVVWKASFFNHSCTPDLLYHCIGNGEVYFQALRSIQKDEEIFVSYYHKLLTDTASRRQCLLQTWEFHCMCQACANGGLISDYRRDRIHRTTVGQPEVSVTRLHSAFMTNVRCTELATIIGFVEAEHMEGMELWRFLVDGMVLHHRNPGPTFDQYHRRLKEYSWIWKAGDRNRGDLGRRLVSCETSATAVHYIAQWCQDVRNQLAQQAMRGTGTG
jgi:hypothetical protein